MRKIARRAAIGIIQFYRGGISPYLPPHCRYTPTCSSYAIEAISRFGIVRGAWLAVKRISRCHPWHDGGYDPVPDAAQHAKKLDTNINHKH